MRASHNESKPMNRQRKDEEYSEKRRRWERSTEEILHWCLKNQDFPHDPTNTEHHIINLSQETFGILYLNDLNVALTPDSIVERRLIRDGRNIRFEDDIQNLHDILRVFVGK